MSAHLHQSSEDARFPVFLVGERNLALEGLRTLLSRNNIDIDDVATTVSNLQLAQDLNSRRFLVIFDVTDAAGTVPDDIEALRLRFPQVCIILLLGRYQTTVSLLPNDLRVNAILDRNIACEALMKTLRVAMAGFGVMSPVPDVEPREMPVARARGSDKPSGLSDRETEIIGCIAEGHSNKVIARRFSISEATVKIHVRGILRKVDARNRTQAAIWAVQKGFGNPLASLAG